MPLMYFGRLVGGVPNVGFERRRACAVIAVAEAEGVFAVGILARFEYCCCLYMDGMIYISMAARGAAQKNILDT